jgi:hypothetical protein
MLAEQGAEGAEQADQAEGAHAGARGGDALAFEPHQQPDADRDQQGFDLRRIEGNGIGHGLGLASAGAPPAAPFSSA